MHRLLFVSFLLLGVLVCRGASSSQQVWSRFQAQSAAALEQARRTGAKEEPLPAGVQELRFQDVFKPVIGDRGPEYTDRIKSLDGKRVRVTGFMVRENQRTPGVFMFAPWPSRIESDGFCLNEDYPPSTIHVLVGGAPARLVPFTPSRVSLVGILEVKPLPMPDGRNCVACLRLDPETAQQANVAATP